LSLENPEDPNVDIGSNSYDYKKVNRAISNAYESVKAALNTEQNEIKQGRHSSNSSSSSSSSSSRTGKSLLSLIIDVGAARTDSRTQTKRESMSRGGGGGGRRSGGGRGGRGGGRGRGRGGRHGIPMSRR
jgi:hypothetical protein